MAFNCLDLMAPGKTSIPIHHERNMLWYWTLSHSSNQEFSNMIYPPFHRR